MYACSLSIIGAKQSYDYCLKCQQMFERSSIEETAKDRPFTKHSTTILAGKFRTLPILFINTINISMGPSNVRNGVF